MVLELVGVTKRFGGLMALNGFSMHVPRGVIRGLIGPNGAGKTTVFNVITGAVNPDGGRILFQGRSIGGYMPHKVVRFGIARTFQNIRLFQRLSCLENVCVPMLQSLGPVKSLWGFSRDRTLEDRARMLLHRVGLWDVMDRPAGTLPYGLQRKLEIARALASSPKLLLLDEPAAGMNPEESRALGDFICRVRDEFCLTVILIEHHMDLVMRVCDDVTVMNFGAVLFHGTPCEVARSQQVMDAYLGSSRAVCHA